MGIYLWPNIPRPACIAKNGVETINIYNMKNHYSFILAGLMAALPAASWAAVAPHTSCSSTGFSKMAAERLAPRKSAARTQHRASGPAHVITKAPGERHTFFRNVEGFGLNFFGMPEAYTASGVAQTFSFDGNDVYMYSPISTYPTDSWIKGTVTDEGFLFTFPQSILREFDDDPEWGYEQFYDVNLLELVHDEDYGDFYEMPEDNVPNELLLRRLDDGSYGFESEIVECYNTEDDETYYMPRYIVAVTTCWDDEEYFPEWIGYGDFFDNQMPFNGTPVEAPADLTTRSWTVVSESDGHDIKVGFDGTDVYFQGLFNEMPEAWVKGTLANGMVTIPCGQFVGINPDTNLFCFFYAGAMNAYFDEETWRMAFDIDIDENGVLSFNEDNQRMETNQGFVLFSSEKAMTASGYLQTPTIMVQPADIDLTPVLPEITGYMDYGTWGNYAGVQFLTSTLDSDGYWIGPSADFSYRLISDGNPVIFSHSEDYPFINEEMEWVPYTFTDNYSIMIDNRLVGDMRDHMVYYHVLSEQYTAIQVRYVDPANGKEYLSKKLVFWGNDPNTVEATDVDADAECEYFNLQGIRVASPEKGIYIRRVGGNVEKVIIR